MDSKLFIYLLLIGILCTTSFSAYMVFKHYDLYANDPMVYGAKNYDIDYCTCYTNEGKIIEVTQEAVILKQTPSDYFNINLEN